MDKGNTLYSFVSLYSFSVFHRLQFIIANTLIFVYLDLFKVQKINSQEIPIMYRHPCFDFYFCAQILDISCTSKGIWEWQKFSLAFTSVLYLPHKTVVVRIMLLLKKSIRRYNGLASLQLYALYHRFSCNFNYVTKQKPQSLYLSAVAFPLGNSQTCCKSCMSFHVMICSSMMLNGQMAS